MIKIKIVSPFITRVRLKQFTGKEKQRRTKQFFYSVSNEVYWSHDIFFYHGRGFFFSVPVEF